MYSPACYWHNTSGLTVHTQLTLLLLYTEQDVWQKWIRGRCCVV